MKVNLLLVGQFFGHCHDLRYFAISHLVGSTAAMASFPEKMSSAGQAKAGPQLLVSLQYLRAIAAMLVVYFHAALQVSVIIGGEAAIPMFGSSGVDLFFVISGFMMWYSVGRREQSPVEFMRRRIVRIVPLYWTVTAAALVVALVAPSLLRSTQFDPAHSIASFFFVPWPNPASVAAGASEVMVPLVVPGWTLNFEMMFYLLFACTLAIPTRLRLVGVALLLALLFVVAGLFPAESPVRFYHNSILFEFLAGVLLGVVGLEKRLPISRLALPMVIAAFVILLVLDYMGGENGFRLVLFGIPATMIVAIILCREAHGPVPFVRWLDEIGNASYSIYLTHIFVLAALRVLVVKLGVVGPGLLFQFLFMAAALAISAGVGFLTYRLIEQPGIRLMRQLTVRKAGADVAAPA